MKSAVPLSIFFPACNEEANIAETVRQAEAAARMLTDTYEIIIVDDGSRDRTGEIADSLARLNPRVRAVHHPLNRGYGAALWSGIQAAHYPYVFWSDADLQFDLRELRKLVRWVPEYRAVLGYRAPRRDPWMRLLNARGWNWLNRLLFGLRARDIDCAFKLFERELVAGLPIESRGAMFSAELLVRLVRQGIRWKEVAVTHRPRRRGSATGASPRVILRAFRELAQVYNGDLGRPALVQAFKFAAVGVVNTLVDVLAYFALTRGFRIFGDHLVATKSLSFFFGTISSFILNRRWTFGVADRLRWNEVAKFYATVLSALVVNTAAMFLLVRVLGLYDLAAVGIATLVTFLWSFSLSRSWVFAPPSASPLFDKPRKSATFRTG